MGKKNISIDNRGGFVFYRSFYEAVKELPLSNQANYYNAIFNYIFNDKLDDLNGVEKSLFILIKPTLDFNKKQFGNGKKGGRPIKSNNNIVLQNNPNITQTKPNDNPTITLRIKNKEERIRNKEVGIKNKDTYKQTTKFIIPSLNEIKEYVILTSLSVDACYFFDYYESKGWLIGNNKMKDWKATIRNWDRRNEKPKLLENKEKLKLEEYL